MGFEEETGSAEEPVAFMTFITFITFVTFLTFVAFLTMLEPISQLVASLLIDIESGKILLRK